MSKALADFYDMLLPQLPGCTTDFLDFNLVALARDFCGRTSAWRERFAPINTVADQARYVLNTIESQADIVRVTRLTVNDILLWDDTLAEDKARIPITPKYQRQNAPFTVSSDLRFITLIDDEVPTTAVVGGLEPYGAMRPELGATRLPDMLMTQYSEAIRTGVLARMMVMNNKWRDLALAKFYGDEYQSWLGFAGYQGSTGNSQQPLRTKKAGI